MRLHVFRERRHGFEAPIAWLIVGCALLLASCSDSPGPAASDGDGAPTVVPSDAWEPPTLTEADILADRILRREDGGLLVDAAERRQLAGEVAPVLSAIRDAYPSVADVTARAPYAPGELLLTLEPWLFEDVSALLDDPTGPVVLRTGHTEFDALNERLGLSTVVDMVPASGTVVLYFNEYLNVPAAAAAYAMLEGVQFSEPNAYLGDGSDLDAVKSEGRWHVVVRHAWGDCPAGCINEELHFFAVDGTDVERTDRAQVMESAAFSDLVTNRGWDSEAAAPVVVPSDAWEPPALTEADILAHQLLQEDGALLVDATERDELGREIGRVLSQIRAAYPEVADVTARERHTFGVLLLGLEPELFGTVSELLEGQAGVVTLRTGYAAFDSLNERLGLSVVVRMFPISEIVTFYFDEYLNVDAAAQAYATVEGVEFAEPDSYLGDGSDIAAKKSQGRWYVVFRRAWGDCPAGCINEELYFSIVEGTNVERVDPAQAMGIAEFRDLVENRGW